jgi:DNA polymerase-3 subunit gamma/tau
MSYQVLARKWRPRNFEQVVGQDAVKQALVNGLDNDRVHHAFLLTGTRGVGKTTLARILAKSLNCERGVSSTPCGECGSCVDVDEGRFVDMLEIDAASKTGVDDIRDLIDNAQYSPTRGRYKVYIIDEVHMLSRNAFNGLLKTLEEPPPHVKFVLATTDADRIPVTILSRCLRFNLRRLLPDQIGDYLTQLLKAESIESEPAAVTRIAQAADGSMRDGLSLLDQAIAFGGGKLVEQEVAQMLGSVDHAHLVSLIDAIVAADGDTMLETVAELSAQARDLESVLGGLAEILHRICLIHCAPGYRDAERSDWDSIEQLAARVSAADAQLFYQIAVQGARDLALAPDPRTGLEMALMRMMAFRPAEAVPTGGSGQAPAGQSDAAPARQPVATPSSRSARPQRAPEPATNTAPAVTPPAEPRTRPSSPQARGGEGDDWHGLLERLDLNGPVRELARNIELESRSGDQWRFVIPEAVSHYGSQALVQKLESELSNQLGEAVHLVISTSSRAVRTPAVLHEDASRAALNEAERAIEQDPTVRELKDRLGAVVLDDSVQPLQ